VKSLGFSWSEEVGPGTIIKASHVNEIKDNTDTVYSDLSLDYPGCTGAGWVELPVSVGESVKSSHLQELRDRIDYADDNKCTSVCNADDATVNDTYNSTVENTFESTVYESVDPSYNGSYHTSFDTDHLATTNYSEDGTYDSQVLTGNRSGDYGTYLDIDWGTVQSLDQANENSSYDSTVDSTAYNTVDSGNYGTNNTSEYTSDCGGHNSSVNELYP